MPRVRLDLEDDNGNPMPNTEQIYLLEGDCDTINQIESAVETFKQRALPVVALTDGARCIRTDLTAVFGAQVSIILDWYHLQKRVYEHLAMSAHSRSERESWEKSVLGLLWRGKVDAALAFLGSLSPRTDTGWERPPI